MKEVIEVSEKDVLILPHAGKALGMPQMRTEASGLGELC